MSTSLHDSLTALVETVSERVQRGGVKTIGIEGGFPNLDDVLLGFRRRAVYVIAARPGMGKTSLGLSLIFNVAKNHHPVLFLSLEMGAELLSLRVLAMQTGIPSSRIEKGQLTAQELEKVKQVLALTKDLTFRVIDDTLDSGTFVKYIEKYQREYGLDFLVVDYISLFRDSTSMGENQRLSDISKNMLEVARRCDIPVIVLAQLNREVEKRENHLPMLSDIRDSGSIEQDAFAVIFCYRPHYYKMMIDGEPPKEVEEDAKLIIAKHRQGEIGAIKAHFHPAQTLWTPPNIKIGQPPKISDA